MYSFQLEEIVTYAPTILSADISSDGKTLVIGFDQIVVAGADGFNGFSVETTGFAVVLTYASGSGTEFITYNISRTIHTSETLSNLAYTQPGDGIQNDAPQLLATVSGQPVVNNSTITSEIKNFLNVYRMRRAN